MAEKQRNTSAGWSKPKASFGGSDPSAKERSRAQSRPVSGRTRTGKSGKASGASRGGNRPKPAGRPRAAIPAPRRLSGTMMAWGTVGLVVVIIVVLVVVKAGSGNGTTSSPHQAIRQASGTLVKQVTEVPASVFDAIGAAIPSEFAGNHPNFDFGSAAFDPERKGAVHDVLRRRVLPVLCCPTMERDPCPLTLR